MFVQFGFYDCRYAEGITRHTCNGEDNGQHCVEYPDTLDDGAVFVRFVIRLTHFSLVFSFLVVGASVVTVYFELICKISIILSVLILTVSCIYEIQCNTKFGREDVETAYMYRSILTKNEYF